MGIEIVSIMAGFSFGYCIMDIIQNYLAKRQVEELLKSTVETRQVEELLKSTVETEK